MNSIPTRCPFCGGEISITRIHCEECQTTIEGRFTGGRFSSLTAEQLNFVETFIRCEGKINRMEDEINLSYPTIRNRLHEIIRALGYEPGQVEDSGRLNEQSRQRILDELDQGLISAKEAMALLQDR